MCIVLLFWATASSRQMQQAMRWWFKQEAIDRAAHSDQIQNGLIQDLFAVRLSLQSPLPEQTEDRIRQQQIWVAEADKLHEHLSHLSNTLTQPYLAESLPLSIRSLLKRWEIAHPNRTLRLDLPLNWHTEPLERNRIILVTLNTLLKLTVPSSISHATLEITLIDRLPQAELIVKITYPDLATRRSNTRARELKYLCRCFRCLAPGRCFYQPQSSVAVWRFKWNP
jgi:hypothetical protein